MTDLARFRTIVPVILALLSAQPLSAANLNGLSYPDLGESITIKSSTPAIKGDLVIPETIDGKPVTSIGKRAFFSRWKLKSVSLPSGLTSVEPLAFANCRNLTCVNIPSGVTTIGSRAFHYCENLSDLRISFGVKTIGASAFARCAFARCGSLKNVRIPGSVVEIGARAFSGCDNLSDLDLPSSVTTLGNFAFSVYGFTHFQIPATVTSLGSSVFSACRQLKKVKIFPGNLVNLPQSMFADCALLEEVKLPPNITRIRLPCIRNFRIEVRRTRAFGDVHRHKGVFRVSRFASCDLSAKREGDWKSCVRERWKSGCGPFQRQSSEAGEEIIFIRFPRIQDLRWNQSQRLHNSQMAGLSFFPSGS
jgi:hypothetical protein